MRFLPVLALVAWTTAFAQDYPNKQVVVAALQAAVQDATFKSRLADLGAEPVPVSKANPEALRTHLKAETDKWGPIIKESRRLRRLIWRRISTGLLV